MMHFSRVCPSIVGYTGREYMQTKEIHFPLYSACGKRSGSPCVSWVIDSPVHHVCVVC